MLSMTLFRFATCLDPGFGGDGGVIGPRSPKPRVPLVTALELQPLPVSPKAAASSQKVDADVKEESHCLSLSRFHCFDIGRGSEGHV
jgi:hypothetical protein